MNLTLILVQSDFLSADYELSILLHSVALLSSQLRQMKLRIIYKAWRGYFTWIHAQAKVLVNHCFEYNIICRLNNSLEGSLVSGSAHKVVASVCLSILCQNLRIAIYNDWCFIQGVTSIHLPCDLYSAIRVFFVICNVNVWLAQVNQSKRSSNVSVNVAIILSILTINAFSLNKSLFRRNILGDKSASKRLLLWLLSAVCLDDINSWPHSLIVCLWLMNTTENVSLWLAL